MLPPSTQNTLHSSHAWGYRVRACAHLRRQSPRCRLVTPPGNSWQLPTCALTLIPLLPPLYVHSQDPAHALTSCVLPRRVTAVFLALSLAPSPMLSSVCLRSWFLLAPSAPAPDSASLLRYPGGCHGASDRSRAQLRRRGVLHALPARHRHRNCWASWLPTISSPSARP